MSIDCLSTRICPSRGHTSRGWTTRGPFQGNPTVFQRIFLQGPYRRRLGHRLVGSSWTSADEHVRAWLQLCDVWSRDLLGCLYSAMAAGVQRSRLALQQPRGDLDGICSTILLQVALAVGAAAPGALLLALRAASCFCLADFLVTVLRLLPFSDLKVQTMA